MVLGVLLLTEGVGVAGKKQPRRFPENVHQEKENVNVFFSLDFLQREMYSQAR